MSFQGNMECDWSGGLYWLFCVECWREYTCGSFILRSKWENSKTLTPFSAVLVVASGVSRNFLARSWYWAGDWKAVRIFGVIDGQWCVEKGGFEEVTVRSDHERMIRAEATRPVRDGRFDVSLMIEWL